MFTSFYTRIIGIEIQICLIDLFNAKNEKYMNRIIMNINDYNISYEMDMLQLYQIAGLKIQLNELETECLLRLKKSIDFHYKKYILVLRNYSFF